MPAGRLLVLVTEVDEDLRQRPPEEAATYNLVMAVVPTPPRLSWEARMTSSSRGHFTRYSAKEMDSSSSSIGS
jgi:hypothetical protein